MKAVTRSVLVSSMLALSACGGGGAQVKSHNTTMGQELMDLEKAHQAGILTDREYKKAKRKILKQQ